MKKTITTVWLAFACLSAHAQSVGINTTPALTAALDVSSTNKGILIPRLATGVRTGIASPATGLLVYDATLNAFYYYNGAAWLPVAGSSSSAASPLYGDGSAGALNISSSTNWATTAPTSLNFQFSSIIVASGATFTVPSGTKLRCNGTVTIAGNIVVDGSDVSKVVPGEKGISRTFPTTSANPGKGIAPGAIVNLINIPLYGGAAGGYQSAGDLNYGGAGGGTFAIYANGALSVSGTIRADGGNGFGGSSTSAAVNGCGGGGGGVLVLMSKASIANTGTISADAGDGSPGILASPVSSIRPGGGGGGGGIVMLLAPSINQGTITVAAGSGGANSGAGTNSTTFGGAGGGSAGNGGNGGIGSSSATPVPATAGTGGIIKTIITSTPESLY